MRDRADLKSPGIMGGDASAADTKRGEFDLFNMQLFCNETPVDIDFYGDSITYLLEPNAFYARFGVCIDRGICGDSVHIMERRFEADVLQLRPRLCVMMGGINNTWILDEHMTDEKYDEAAVDEACDLVRNSYAKILDAAKAAGQAMMICSIMPVTHQIDHADLRNAVVLRMNRDIKDLCAQYDVPYIDYHSALCKEDGCTLRDGLTDDGLHPHYKGFLLMSEVLTPHLEEFFKK